MAQKTVSVASSAYMKRMAYLSGRIFVDFSRPTSARDRKVAERLSVMPPGRMRALWYPPLDSIYTIFGSLRSIGVYRDEYKDFQEEMDRLRKLRGKESTYNLANKKKKKS